jgi:site-specific recombinase XerD
VIAIPVKRCDQPVLGFLARNEVEAILDAPDASTWSGRRDRILFATLYNTGARVSEITSLRIADVLIDRESAVHLRGKGRKERVVPLWKNTAVALREWTAQNDRHADAPVFPNSTGKPLSRSGVEHRLRLAVKAATKRFPSFAGRRISPHTFRHTTAMHLLQSGVDLAVIALWLGHENPSTTHLYLEADLDMKSKALAKIVDPSPRRARFRATDRVLAFLEAL